MSFGGRGFAPACFLGHHHHYEPRYVEYPYGLKSSGTW